VRSPQRETLSGRVALVTGATGTMGAAIAQRLADEGAAVVGVGRTRETGLGVAQQIVAGGGQACFVTADVSCEDQVREAVAAAVESSGRLDVVALGSIRSVQTAHIHDDPVSGPARRRNRMIPEPGTVQDVAELVAYLASPRSASLTAAVVPLDGGAMSAYPAPVIAEAKSDKEG
jgi:NAD(P)-dependent dehydrogenase (short-subunit alcohol dehydrogenase family)